MLRSARILLFAVTLSALAYLVLAARTALAEDAAHRWSQQGLSWLALERFDEVPLGRAVLIVCGLAFLTALLIDARTRTGTPWKRALQLIGHPFVALAAVLLALLGPSLVASALRPGAPTEAPNLLFVMVDTWRADHAGFLGYERDVSPHLDRLAETGVVFENAIAQAPWTKPSVATLFTGEVPSRHGAVSNPIQGRAVRGLSLAKSRTTFLEILRGRGWDTAAWSSNPNVVPQRGFAQGAGYFYDGFNDARHSASFDPGRSEHLIADARRWLADERDSARPFAAYVHVMDPHYPYEAPPPFGGKFARPDIGFELDGKVCQAFYDGERDVSEVTPEILQHVIASYDEEIAYMDHWVGPFVEDVLREHPNTVVVLVSDHGEEFLEHGQFGHGIGLWNTLVHVPLVLWAPGLGPGRVRSQVRLMDVAPTLYELVGLATSKPASTQGESLLAVIGGGESAHRLAPMENGGDGRPAWQRRGISDGRTKALRREPDLPDWPAPPLTAWETGREFPDLLCFDLEQDPEELQDRAADAGAAVLAEELFERSRAAGWLVEPAELFSGLRAQRVDVGAAAARLEHLGYGVGDGGAGRGSLKGVGGGIGVGICAAASPLALDLRGAPFP